MNEVEFRNWLVNKGTKVKVAGDIISRLKRIERELKNCDIDEQYRSDKCDFLMSLFVNKGLNENMKSFPGVTFPIGKYYMSTYRHSLKLYITFCEETL